MTLTITARDALIIVDPQKDFCPGGALAVPGGNEIIPMLGPLADRFKTIVVTADAHPEHHSSFASSHAGKKPYDVITMPYGAQVLWPDHCKQGDEGMDLHDNFPTSIEDRAMFIRKGMNPDIDSYSAFLENDMQTPTGLKGYLRERDVQRIFVVGLAYDFCVGFTALDAVRYAKFPGADVFVVKDLTRAIDLDGSVAAMEAQFGDLDIQIITSGEIA